MWDQVLDLIGSDYDGYSYVSSIGWAAWPGPMRLGPGNSSAGAEAFRTLARAGSASGRPQRNGRASRRRGRGADARHVLRVRVA